MMHTRHFIRIEGPDGESITETDAADIVEQAWSDGRTHPPVWSELAYQEYPDCWSFACSIPAGGGELDTQLALKGLQHWFGDACVNGIGVSLSSVIHCELIHAGARVALYSIDQGENAQRTWVDATGNQAIIDRERMQLVACVLVPQLHDGWQSEALTQLAELACCVI